MDSNALMRIEQKPLITLGKTIRVLRLQKKLSQEELAHIAELDRSYVGQVERAERNISFKNLCKIADALDVSVSKMTEGI